MKKSRRRIKFISLIILTLVMIAGLIAIVTKKSNIYAADPNFTEDNVKYTYNSTTKTLTIQGEGTATGVWKNNDTLGMTDDQYKTIENVKITIDVKGIGEDAFSGCTSLTKVTFNSTSAVKTIGKNAFSGCTSLSNIMNGRTNNQLPESITTIEDKAFSGCTNLAELDLNTGLTDIGTGVFETCNPTIQITLKSEVTYPIEISGKYKIELYGQQGFNTSSGGQDGDRMVKGGLGSYVLGYMSLNKNNTLTVDLYDGGKSAIHYFGSSTTKKHYGGIGGNGIGLKLNNSETPIAAAGRWIWSDDIRLYVTIRTTWWRLS